jgi:ligand-binding sensor protein
MKIRQLQMLQNLQDAYSSLCGLTILITDQEGNWVTELSGIMDLVRLLLKVPELSLSVLSVLMMEKIHPIDNPIVYETDKGFKLAVAPIRIRGQAIYYIIAGIMVDESSKGLIAQSFFVELPEERELWENALQVTHSNSKERIKLILLQLEELAEIIQILLEQEAEKGKTAYRLQLLNLISLMDRNDANWQQGILKVFVQAMELEFAGVAFKSAGEKYNITETIGFKKEASIKGATFYNGEGLLGQVSLTKQMGYWEKLESDPRAAFFRTSGVNPNILICYPIKYKKQLFGLLFGVHSTKVELSDEMTDIGTLLANKIAVYLYGI